MLQEENGLEHMGKIITFKQKGDFSITKNFLNRSKRIFDNGILEDYGEKGVQALQNATPKYTGKTASSWYYKIKKSKASITIEWLNSNTNEGVSIALILQYGHASQNGVYVSGVDYINPAIKPIFDGIANSIWTEVTKK